MLYHTGIASLEMENPPLLEVDLQDMLTSAVPVFTIKNYVLQLTECLDVQY